jgi:ABC-2 type transport system ATP-binding protein
MFEADELCDRIAIINKGKLVILKPPSELKALAKEVSVVEVLLSRVVEEELETLKKNFSGTILSLQEKNGGCNIQLNAQLNKSVLAEITSILEKSPITLIRIKEPTLEDAYLNLLGGGHEL